MNSSEHRFDAYVLLQNTMLEEYLETSDMASALATLKDIAVNK